MTQQDLDEFVAFASCNKQIHSQLLSAATPEDVLEIAFEPGCELEISDLSRNVGMLHGVAWYWSDKNPDWLRAFTL